jgi:transposase
MPKLYTFSEDEKAELHAARKKNKNKSVERRLKALELRAQGVPRGQVAAQTGYGASYVSVLVRTYREKGISAITENHYVGSHRNLSFAEEEELLKPFREAAQAGQIVEVRGILRAYEERLGRSFEKDHGRIYQVLKRHDWRKIMPRSKHPNSATPEAIEASKKLTWRSKKPLAQ